MVNYLYNVLCECKDFDIKRVLARKYAFSFPHDRVLQVKLLLNITCNSKPYIMAIEFWWVIISV